MATAAVLVVLFRYPELFYVGFQRKTLSFGRRAAAIGVATVVHRPLGLAIVIDQPLTFQETVRKTTFLQNVIIVYTEMCIHQFFLFLHKT